MILSTTASNVPVLKKRDGRSQSFTDSKIKRYLINLAAKGQRLNAVNINKIIERLQSTMSMSMTTNLTLDDFVTFFTSTLSCMGRLLH